MSASRFERTLRPCCCLFVHLTRRYSPPTHQAARVARQQAEHGMRNARDAETELRQQLANLELEYSEQSGQVAALMERVRRQEEVASASTYDAALTL